jgi:hypothetical protein
MPLRRAAESVPDAEDGIEEVVIRHRRTKRGVRTTEKVVPVLRPGKVNSGQPSKSKKGKQSQPPSQLETDNAEGSGGAFPTIDDVQTDQFIDEQEDGLPDLGTEQSQPDAKVCTRHHLQLNRNPNEV